MDVGPQKLWHECQLQHNNRGQDWLGWGYCALPGLGVLHGFFQRHGAWFGDHLWQRRLLFMQEPPSIPWQSLRDNPVNQVPGWNFLQDDRNVKLGWPGSNSWLLDKIGQNAKLQKRFVFDGEWKTVAASKYLADVMEFKSNLLILMHLTGGQPARGPELLNLKHTNTTLGLVRNIFIEDGLVVFVTGYHKGYHSEG